MKFRNEWRELRAGFEDVNVLNLDESRLEWRHYSRKSVVDSHDKGFGMKESKDGITIAPIVNAAGGKEALIVISKSRNPRCFKHKNVESLRLIFEVSLRYIFF